MEAIINLNFIKDTGCSSLVNYCQSVLFTEDWQFLKIDPNSDTLVSSIYGIRKSNFVVYILNC